MDWLEIFGWFVAFSLITNFCYRKGVKTGIKHALTTLHLDHHQTEILKKELKKDSHDITMEAMKAMKKDIAASNKSLLN